MSVGRRHGSSDADPTEPLSVTAEAVRARLLCCALMACWWCSYSTQRQCCESLLHLHSSERRWSDLFPCPPSPCSLSNHSVTGYRAALEIQHSAQHRFPLDDIRGSSIVSFMLTFLLILVHSASILKLVHDPLYWFTIRSSTANCHWFTNY